MKKFLLSLITPLILITAGGLVWENYGRKIFGTLPIIFPVIFLTIATLGVIVIWVACFHFLEKFFNNNHFSPKKHKAEWRGTGVLARNYAMGMFFGSFPFEVYKCNFPGCNREEHFPPSEETSKKQNGALFL